MKYQPCKVPTNGHPFVRRLRQEMNDKRIPQHAVAKATGLSVNTLKKWPQRAPNICDLEAALEAVGLYLEINTIQGPKE